MVRMRCGSPVRRDPVLFSITDTITVVSVFQTGGQSAPEQATKGRRTQLLLIGKGRCDDRQISPDLLPIALFLFLTERGIFGSHLIAPSLDKIGGKDERAVWSKCSARMQVTLPMRPPLMFNARQLFNHPIEDLLRGFSGHFCLVLK